MYIFLWLVSVALLSRTVALFWTLKEFLNEKFSRCKFKKKEKKWLFLAFCHSKIIFLCFEGSGQLAVLPNNGRQLHHHWLARCPIKTTVMFTWRRSVKSLEVFFMSLKPRAYRHIWRMSMDEHWDAITGTSKYLSLFDTDNGKTQFDVIVLSVYLDFFHKIECMHACSTRISLLLKPLLKGRLAQLSRGNCWSTVY